MTRQARPLAQRVRLNAWQVTDRAAAFWRTHTRTPGCILHLHGVEQLSNFLHIGLQPAQPKRVAVPTCAVGVSSLTSAAG